ncbi:MAG: thiopeptide-type bacteriocin biosynthesis protein [Pseudonocardia sp.]
MSHGPDPHPAEGSWRQVFVHFHDYAAAEHTGAVHIGPTMTSAEAAGEITSWFFIRKNPCWRLRFLPAHDSTEQDAAALVYQRLDTLHDAGHIANWVETIYEPETYAFGGPAGMSLAHHLFHADSRHTLAYLSSQGASTSAGRDQRRELSVLLCSTLIRGAGQDWYEQADIWARVAQIRPDPPDLPSDRLSNLESGLRRLMAADTSPTSPLLHRHGSLAFLAEWAAAFAEAGQTLGDLAHNATLTRGLRAVLAHHLIFHWNRLGLPSTTQSLLAHTAKAVVFGRDETGTVPDTPQPSWPRTLAGSGWTVPPTP